MWSCPKISSFWLSVQNEIKKMFRFDIPLNPYHFVLGLDANCDRRYRYILRVALYAARLTILHKWLDEDPPNITMWYEKCMSILPLERLSHVIRNTLDVFVREWSPLELYLKEEWSRLE